MVGWHHQLNRHEFEQTLGDSEGQGSLAHGVAKSQTLATEQQHEEHLVQTQGNHNAFWKKNGILIDTCRIC